MFRSAVVSSLCDTGRYDRLYHLLLLLLEQQARRSYVKVAEHATAGQASHGKYHALNDSPDAIDWARARTWDGKDWKVGERVKALSRVAMSPRLRVSWSEASCWDCEKAEVVVGMLGPPITQTGQGLSAWCYAAL